jgi:signal transduction histidine kinase
MAKLGQSSFRRILLSRLLLLSVPVLLAGVYVTYRKARSGLLETARQNLIESAVRKGEDIQESIAALKINLAGASESVVFRSESPDAYQDYIEQFAERLPSQIQCVQLANPQTQAIVASTCGDRQFDAVNSRDWPEQLATSPRDVPDVAVMYLPSTNLPGEETQAPADSETTAQLPLLFSAPVYDADGQLQYELLVQTSLVQQTPTKPRSLSGYPVVIDQDGTILAHPERELIGRNIDRTADERILQNILNNALAGRRYFQHLFAFDPNDVEALSGYTAIPSPITTSAEDRQWVVLAMTPLDNALAGLREIQQALFILTFGLIAANFLATLYVARDIARPLEKLRDYALNESQLLSTERIPHNLKIREFEQLSEALNSMIARLRSWAEELEAAWKEAQLANQLKNEFLANTSHELRTPLNGIIGCLRLVRDGFCDDREEELDFLQRADNAAIHLLGIINDVLDLAKIEAGKLSVDMEPVDLRQVLDEVIDLQAVPTQQKGLELHTADLHGVIPVRADPAKLKQVLLNVVGNAVKFTDTGSITIQTRIEAIADEPQNGADNGKTSASNAEQVIVTVRDTGIGIDPQQQQKLFRPFVMVDGSTTRKCGGAGLGLAISRNLIELMGGRITLFSEGAEQGTTVEISLPTIEASLLPSGESKASDVTSLPG